MPKHSFHIAFALIAVALLHTSLAHAQAITWTGGSGNWDNSNTSQWSPPTIPTASDTVTINAGSNSTVTVVGSQVCASLTVGGGSFAQLIQIGGSGALLTVGGASTINAQGTVEVDLLGTLAGTGSLTNASGTFKMNGGTCSLPVTNNAVCTITGSSTSTFSSTTFTSSGGVTWNASNTLALNNTTFTNSGVFTADNSQVITATGSTAFNNTGVFNKSSNSTGTAVLASNCAFTNGPSGSVIVAAGSTLTITVLTNYNTGTSTLSGGSYLLDGVLQINVSGLIATNSASVLLNTASADIKNSGGSPMFGGLTANTMGSSITLSGGANLLSSASSQFNNDGAIFVNSGCIFNSGSGKLNVSSTGIMDPNGGTIHATGGIDLQGGSIVGNGTLNANVNNNGLIGTSSSAQPLSVTGNYTQTAAGMFLASIAGPTSIGSLAISGTANIAGIVEPAISYTPATGDVLPVVTFASAVGQFDTISPTVTPNGLLLTQQVTGTAIKLAVGGTAPTTPPTIVFAAADSSAVVVGTTVNFTAGAVDPSGLPLTYSWDFGDGTAKSPGSSVSHIFTSEATWTVTLTVSNGVTNVNTTLSIMALSPNSGGAGIPNLSDGQSAANPLNGLTITLVKSDGGLCQFSIDINALIRAQFTASTDFDTIEGRNSTVTGLTPVFKADNSNIYIATTSATDTTTNTIAGKGRKTIGMSGAEVGAPPKVKTPPKNHLITNSQTKGKFTFGKPTGATKGTPDSVIFTGSFELPEGLDLSPNATQDFQFSIGNILDSITINSKGKTVGKSKMSRIKKLTITFPRLPKGQTLTTAGQTAKFSVTINQVGLSAAGFDTEGITNTYATNEKSLKSVKRSLQVAMVFAGVVWQATAPVTYTLSTKGDSGVMAGRSGQ